MCTIISASVSFNICSLGCTDYNECCFGDNPRCNHNCEINICENTIGSFTCGYCPWEEGKLTIESTIFSSKNNHLKKVLAQSTPHH